MPTEKPLQDLYTRLLEARQVEYIRISANVYRRVKDNCIRLLPDITFLFNGTLYMREFGVPGRHLDRKGLQHDKMMRWAAQGADIAIITSEDAAVEDMKKIGLTANTTVGGQNEKTGEKY